MVHKSIPISETETQSLSNFTEIPLTKVKNETGGSIPSNTIKVEDVYTQLGGFSRFQVFATVIILSLEISGAMVALSPILTTTTQVDFFCDTEDSSILLTKGELCTNNCSGSISAKKPFKSIVQEWNLICDKAWISDALTSVFMTGNAIGPLITAQIADRFGRKPAYFLICALLGISGIFASQAPDVYSYAASRLFSGLATGGCLLAHMNYLLEFLTPSWRIICGCVSLWPLGEMMLALIGYLFPHWRTLSWICVVPAITLIFSYPFLPESPRWLLCKNKTKEAGSVLKTIAKWNSKPEIDQRTLNLLQESVLKGNIEQDTQIQNINRWSTFKNRQILVLISIFFLVWFANALVYYGISFNMKNMSGNPYFNVFLLGLLDWPAELSGMYFSNRFGRKVSFISFLAISICFLVGVASVQIGVKDAGIHYGMLILGLCLMGRFFNETSFAIQTCFTLESFPTIIRSTCFGICTLSSSLGGIVAPQMAYLGSVWAPGPYVVFCGICTISCIVSLQLKETKQKPLHDIH